jgi:phage host-nuclease inhibitor protein Gam
MARIKVAVKPTLEITTWEQAEEIGSKLARLRSKIDAEVAEYNRKEQEKRDALTGKHAPLMAEIEGYVEALRLFCDAERAAGREFVKRKTRDLRHIALSYRVGQYKVEKSKKLTWDGVLDAIKKSAFAEFFVRTKEEPNKDAIIDWAKNYNERTGDGDAVDGVDAELSARAVSPGSLAAMGVAVVQEETFGYEVIKAIEEV